MKFLRLEIHVLAAAVDVGGFTPLAVRAARMASITGSTLVFSIGPFAPSSSARQYARSNGGCVIIRYKTGSFVETSEKKSSLDAMAPGPPPNRTSTSHNRSCHLSFIGL